MTFFSLFESELSTWSDEALAALWADVEEFGQTSVLSADSKIRALAHKWFDAQGSIGALQFTQCCNIAALVVARRVMHAGFGKPHAPGACVPPRLTFISDDDLDETAWEAVTPAEGDVWVLDTNATVTILCHAGHDEWVCGPYTGHNVEPEWTRTHTRGQLRYRASAPAGEPVVPTSEPVVPSCATCAHWLPDPDMTILVDDDDGNCDWVPLFAAGGGVCGMSRSANGRPVTPTSSAVARDADTYAAALATSAVHHCPMWTAVVPQAG